MTVSRSWKYEHTPTACPNGTLDGLTRCELTGDVERVDWLTASGRISRTYPKSTAELSRSVGLCRGCGYQVGPPRP